MKSIVEFIVKNKVSQNNHKPTLEEFILWYFKVNSFKDVDWDIFYDDIKDNINKHNSSYNAFRSVSELKLWIASYRKDRIQNIDIKEDSDEGYIISFKLGTIEFTFTSPNTLEEII